MNEIATYSMILLKIQLGLTSNYCPTKTEILAIDLSVIINNATDYLANECVKLVDIDKLQQNTYIFKFVKNNVDTINTTINSSSITLLENIVTTLNGSWTPFVVHSKSDWITFANNQPGDQIMAGFVRILVSSNPNIGARTGQIVFRLIGSGKLLTWNIVQDGLGENYVFTWEDGTTVNKSFPTDHESINSVHFKIISTLNSNYHPFTINNTASWITITQNNDDVYLNIQANDTYFDRTAVIQFALENSNNILHLTVTQLAMPSPIEESFYFQGYEPTVHERNIGWDHEQHTITIGIVSTYDNTFTPFTVAHFDGSSFLNYSIVSVFGGEPTNVKIDCPQNTTNTSRTEKLILTQNNTGKTLYIEITQTGSGNIYVFTTDMSNVTLNATPGYVIGNVTSTKNGIAHPYQLTSGQVSWVDTTSNLVNGTLTITATQENLGSARTTTLVFTQQDSGKTISIPVTQFGVSVTEQYVWALEDLQSNICYVSTENQNTHPIKFRIPHGYPYLDYTNEWTVISYKRILHDGVLYSTEPVTPIFDGVNTEHVTVAVVGNYSGDPNKFRVTVTALMHTKHYTYMSHSDHMRLMQPGSENGNNINLYMHKYPILCMVSTDTNNSVGVTNMISTYNGMNSNPDYTVTETQTFWAVLNDGIDVFSQYAEINVVGASDVILLRKELLYAGADINLKFVDRRNNNDLFIDGLGQKLRIEYVDQYARSMFNLNILADDRTINIERSQGEYLMPGGVVLCRLYIDTNGYTDLLVEIKII